MWVCRPQTEEPLVHLLQDKCHCGYRPKLYHLPGSCISLLMSVLFIVTDTILLLCHYLGFLHREIEHIALLSLSIDVIHIYPYATAFFRVQTGTDNKMYCPVVPSGLLLFSQCSPEYPKQRPWQMWSLHFQGQKSQLQMELNSSMIPAKCSYSQCAWAICEQVSTQPLNYGLILKFRILWSHFWL